MAGGWGDHLVCVIMAHCAQKSVCDSTFIDFLFKFYSSMTNTQQMKHYGGILYIVLEINVQCS